ncbi:MAG TPA: hypothetical protein VGR62_21340 [Candidatus Binatia bacterium]|nr:hypothetical protein [Candidatus Binatia bacterium]
MRTRLWTVAAIVVAVGALLQPAHAACPGSCDITGGGSARTDCVAGFDGVVLNASGGKVFECTDGQACDTDGALNGACSIRVSVCLKNDVPGCTTNSVVSFDVKNKAAGSPNFDPQRQTLEDAVAALLPASTQVCTDPQVLTTKLKVKKGVFRRTTNVYRTVSESGGVGKDSDKIKVRCLPSTLFPSPTSGYQLATVISNPASLIEGPLSRGRLGDILMANDKLQVVIRQPGRTTLQIGTYGGNIIDADRQRTDGTERDNFEGMAPGINLENTANYTSVVILNDGSNGNPAVVRATGPDDLLDFINPSSVVAGFGFTFPASADDTNLPVDVQTDYILDDGVPYVRMETTLTNTGASPLPFFFADYLNGSGQIELFQPVYGFGEPLLTTSCATSTYVPCTAGTCDLCNFTAYSGEDLASGVSYGYIHGFNGSTAFTTSGVNVALLGREAVLTLIGAAGPNFTLAATGNPGDALTFTRYFAVGTGSVASIIDIRNQIQGITTGTLRGKVTIGNDPIANADVAVTGTVTPGPLGAPTRNVVTHFRTGVDGTYSGTVPAGAYTVQANKDGRLAAAPASAAVNIGAGAAVAQDFTLPAPGGLRVVVTDENGDPSPAKVQLVGFDPSPDLLNTQSILGLINNLTAVFGEPAEDGLVHGISFVTFAPRTGDTGVQETEPGNYQLVVSRGPRYSAATQNVTITAGSTLTVPVQIAKVMDTPGYIAGDWHVHSIDSPDAEVTREERVATMLAEGMDFFTPSDHSVRVSFADTIASMGVGDLIGTATSEEITTFDYGHFNSWPLTIDPLDVDGGGVDHGRAGVLPGQDFPSLGNYSLAPAEIFTLAHSDPRANLIQINHMKSFFNRDGLDIDTAEAGTGPPQSHTPAAARRLDPGVTNFFDTGFDALEVWIGTDGRNGQLNDFLGENIGDWFNLLNQGILRTGVASSDTHQRRTTQLNARTWVASAVSAPSDLAADPETLAGNVVAGRTIGSNAPFFTVDVTTPLATGGLGIGQSTLVSTNDGTATVTLDIKSPRWAEFDRVEFYVNNAPQPFDHDANVATRNRYRVIPNVVKTAGIDFPITVVNDFPSIPGAEHLEATVTLSLTGLTQDTWVVAVVRGSDGVSRPLFPVMPNSLSTAGNTTLANLTDGNLNENGMLAMAFSNPIYLDVDNDTVWTAPGVLLTP